MPTPKYLSIFESLVCGNSLSIVKDDFKPIADVLYPQTAAGSVRLDDSVARAAGLTVLHMDGFTTKPATGDIFTIAGDLQVYTVVSATNLVGTDSDVTFSPGLQVAIPAVDGNEVVTFGLPDFAQRTLGQFGVLRFPEFAVMPSRNTGVDQGQFRDRQARLWAGIAATDIDPVTVTTRLMQYVRVLAVVLETADDQHRFSATAPANRIMTAQIAKMDWEYEAVGKRTNPSVLYRQACHFDLTFDYNER